MAKIIYNYHPDTLEYIGPSEADESPLEPGVYLIPAFATEIEPPAPIEGKMRCFVNGEWQLVDLPPEPEPEPEPEPVDPRALMVVSRFQARAALYLQGMFEQVDALMNDPTTDGLARLAWQDAATFERLSPTVITMGAELGLTDTQLDELFEFAATLKA